MTRTAKFYIKQCERDAATCQRYADMCYDRARTCLERNNLTRAIGFQEDGASASRLAREYLFHAIELKARQGR